MTIGEKITHLRIANGISQERLAEMLKVSRQSISKWESDESLPQIDKIVEFAFLFSLSVGFLAIAISKSSENLSIILNALDNDVPPLKTKPKSDLLNS